MLPKMQFEVQQLKEPINNHMHIHKSSNIFLPVAVIKFWQQSQIFRHVCAVFTSVGITHLNIFVYFMYHQYLHSTILHSAHICIYIYSMDISSNSHYFPIQRYLTGLYNRDKECLLRGTDLVDKIQVNFMFQLWSIGQTATTPRRTH
jgi:hypothetical protein